MVKNKSSDKAGRINEGSELAGFLVQAHLNEYQALTMRNTYWITLQYACWPIVLLYAALVAQVWSSFNHGLLIWVSFVIIQAAVLAWYQAGYEIYRNVVYMETRLRPQLQAIVGSSEFWGYEPYLGQQRGSHPQSYEILPVLGGVLLYLLLTWYRCPWSAIDWVGGVVGAVVLLVIVRQCVLLVKMRGEFFEK
jgi:hypothetical protein